MPSIKKLLGKEDKFFDLLEASAEEARASSAALAKILQTEGSAQSANIHSVSQTRRKDKRITQEITEELCKTFVTPFEREDIEALSIALYRIPKTVEQIVERLNIRPPASRAKISGARSRCSSKPSTPSTPRPASGQGRAARCSSRRWPDSSAARC